LWVKKTSPDSKGDSKIVSSKPRLDPSIPNSTLKFGRNPHFFCIVFLSSFRVALWTGWTHHEAQSVGCESVPLESRYQSARRSK
jgi:hypothetical protein